MEYDNWILAMGIAIFLSFFVAMLGVITGENVVGEEIKILYRALNLFLIIIRLVLEVIVFIIATLVIGFSSFAMGIINQILGTNFKVQIFYNMQTQLLVGIDGMYDVFVSFVYTTSVFNERVMGVDIAFTPKEEFFDAIEDMVDSLNKIWNGSFGWYIEGALTAVGDVWDDMKDLWDGWFKPDVILMRRFN